MAKSKKETDVVKVEEQTKALTDPSAMFAGDAGAGMEGAGAESFAIPFLMILQKLSPQVDESSGVMIEGAKAGMLFENITRKLTDGKEGISIVPCAYRRVFLRWSESKGFQGELLPEDVNRMRQVGEIVERHGKLYVPDKDGNVDPEESDRIADTRNHYVLIVDRKTGGWTQALLSLGSTQIKKSRALMTALASVKVKSGDGMITPATFANLVKATAVPESNDKGSWHGWHFELDGFVDRADMYEAAKQFHKTVIEGQVEHKYDGAEEKTEPESDGF